MKRACMAVMMLLGMGCRFGGGDGITADGSDDDVPGEEPAGTGDGQGDHAGDDPDPPARDAGPGVRDASLSGLDARIVATRDASFAEGALCESPQKLACDPVKGTGCLPFTQCAEVPGDDGAAAGCVLSGLLLDDTCTQDAFSTNCPPQHGCVTGKCKRYCYCDGDCGPGAACVAASGSALKTCE